MITTDRYIAFLEKRASEADSDNLKTSLSEFEAGQGSSREFINSKFNRGNSTSSSVTSDVKKLFPVDSKKESGSAILKLAFFSAVENSNITKLANDVLRDAAFTAFVDEVGKISNTLG